MKFNKYMIAAAALLMVTAASVKPAMAYFTDSHSAKGSVLVSIGDAKLVPNDSAEGLLKTVSVKNTSNYDAFIRVKAIYSNNFKAELTKEAKANGWSLADDGYYYLDEVVAAGETTPEIYIQIEVIEDEIADKFNVVIVEEATRVIYDEAGNTSCNWNSKVMSREEYDSQFTKSEESVENADSVAEDKEIENEEDNSNE